MLFNSFARISLIVVFCLSCNRSQPSQDVEVNEVQLKPLQVVQSYLGVDDDNTQETDLPISNISDIKVDINGSILILDSSTFQLLKISKDGTHSYHTLPQGNGPMEFKSPRILAIGDDNSIFVSDDALLKVVQFDAAINFVNSYPVKYRVSNMVVDSNYLFTLSFAIFRRGAPGIIDRYQLTDPNSITYPIGTSSDIDSDQVRGMAGNTDRLIEMNDELALMRWYPYQITWYSTGGDSLRSISRNVDWFEAPKRSSTGMVDFSSGLRSIGTWCPSECYTVVRYYRLQDGDWTYYWDLFSDFEKEPITLEENYFIDAQPSNILFWGSKIIAQYNEPQPHVKVYAQELK